MHKSKGIIRYDKAACKVIVTVDNGLTDFYRSLIPKAHYAKRPKYKPHITVVRSPPRERIYWWYNWELYEGEQCEFTYSGKIHHNETYYWLQVKSELLCTVRRSLGLESYRFPKEPWFHITIGNTK